MKNFLKTNRRILISFISIIIFTISTIIIIFVAKGYNFNLQNKKVEKTGMIIVNTDPKSTLIYLDDKLQAVSNANLSNLIPGTHHIKVQKDSYSTWEKDIQVQEDIVTQIDVRLFLLNPSLTPITSYGCYQPILNHDESKIVFEIRDTQDKAGIWLLSFNLLPIGNGYDLKKIFSDTDTVAYSHAQYIWSPDDKQLLLQIDFENKIQNILVGVDNGETQILTEDEKYSVITKWKDEQNILNKNKISTLPKDEQDVISKYQDIVWSPDKKMFYYFNENNMLYFYDIEKNKTIESTIISTDYQKIIWFPDNTRLLVVEYNKDTKLGKISGIDIDGQNKVSIYDGILFSPEVFISPNGQKLIFVTNFNSGLTVAPNLYYLNF